MVGKIVWRGTVLQNLGTGKQGHAPSKCSGVMKGFALDARRVVYRRNRSEFPTTSRLLVAIVAAAITGLMTPKAASGTASRL